jgi:hypothetical protein
MSYGDVYGIGIDTDPAAIPDPELLHRYITAAVDQLEARALPPSQRAVRRHAPARRRRIRAA